MPIQELQAKTTSTEFMEWKKFLNDFQKDPQLDHYYLAQIHYEIRRGHVLHPKQVKFEDSLIEFEKKSKKTAPHNSKNMWMGAVGLNKDEIDG